MRTTSDGGYILQHELFTKVATSLPLKKARGTLRVLKLLAIKLGLRRHAHSRFAWEILEPFTDGLPFTEDPNFEQICDSFLKGLAETEAGGYDRLKFAQLYLLRLKEFLLTRSLEQESADGIILIEDGPFHLGFFPDQMCPQLNFSQSLSIPDGFIHLRISPAELRRRILSRNKMPNQKLLQRYLDNENLDRYLIEQMALDSRKLSFAKNLNRPILELDCALELSVQANYVQTFLEDLIKVGEKEPAP